MLAWVAEQSATRGIPVHIHFLETAAEVHGCVERYGERPGPFLERLGLLSDRVVLAHGVWMEEPELERVAAHGATVVTAPVSNLKLAVGRIFPYAAVRAHGIPVGLGTDGASSNNGLDLLGDLKVLALVQKHAADDAAALPAAEAWAVASGGLAPGLRTPPRGGTGTGVDLSTTPQVGDPADFFLARRDAAELVPGHLIENLVYAADHSVVRTTVIGGRVVMRDGAIDGEDEVRARVVERARRLGVL
jgi:5-methylthioadenosine/S-adenosylhomocysteine deaminase